MKNRTASAPKNLHGPRWKGDLKPKFWHCCELERNSNKNLHLGTPIENVHAEDADFGRNAEIQYRISKGAYDDFAINAENGEISLSGELDYVRTHHMFSRILNFLIVLVFKKKRLFDTKLWHFIIYSWMKIYS